MTVDADLSAVRAFYAEELRVTADLRSSALVRALETVPRERFLGPGPWRMRGGDMWGRGGSAYRVSDNDDPRHVYHNVAISLDPARELNNGAPGILAAWIDALAPSPGDRIVHIGCGTGYYTAILAEIVGARGHVAAYEIDEDLAARARDNLCAWPQVEVVPADGATAPLATADIVLVNAGATHPLDAWLDALADDGRLLLPLTWSPVPGSPGKGATLLVTRGREGFAASFHSMVAIFPCSGARDPESGQALGRALMSGGWERVRQLRRDPHERSDSCWLHLDHVCLSTQPIQAWVWPVQA